MRRMLPNQGNCYQLLGLTPLPLYDPFRPLYFTFMNECTSRGRHPCEPMCGIPCERIRPTAGWLLEAQAGREQVVVRVSHSIARPRAARLSEALAEAALRCSTARPRITNISSR